MKVTLFFQGGRQKTFEKVKDVYQYPDPPRKKFTRKQREELVMDFIRKNIKLADTSLNELARKARDEGVYSASTGITPISLHLYTYLQKMRIRG